MSRLFASLYDRIGAGYEAKVMGPRRGDLLADARGVVLELGAGTGANVAHYPVGSQVLLTEPDKDMARRIRKRPELARLDADIVEAPAEGLPVDDGSIDTVVATLVFCSVTDTAAALAEVRRVLRPGGRLLFLEHVRSADPSVAKWQDRVVPVSRRLGGGCHPNRDTVAAIRAAGFQTAQVVAHPTRNRAERFQPLVQGGAVVHAGQTTASAGSVGEA